MEDLQQWLQRHGLNYTIEQLENLQRLNLRFNQIRELPELFCNLSNLRELNK